MSYFCWKFDNCGDLHRFTIIRFAGYCHEVGQHINANFWNLPIFLSGFAAAYVFSDLVDRCRKFSTAAEKVICTICLWEIFFTLNFDLSRKPNPEKTQKKRESESNDKQPTGSRLAIEASDVLIWHSLATIILPHLIVGGVQQMIGHALCKFCHNFEYKKGVSSAVGLLMIPLLSRLLDHLTTEFMEFTYRPLFRST